ncbi:MAG: 3-deoxy-manno-octulosonate cytidylyltransferase [Thermoanaerobaculia bacterium]|nr:3-deoxy-manno-octulosonate cytidylyltransferase [Thermoanaerobaculia bacterium]
MSQSDGIVGAIPARYGSTRLPGKPLLELAGKPMVQHVVERVSRVPEIDRVVVLTDDERIFRAVESFGGEAEMTPADCASGTDRIAYAAEAWSARAVINVQGDEPLIDPQAVSRLAHRLTTDPECEMVTLAAPLPADRLPDPNAVKVVHSRDGRALYFSRAPIPHARHEGEFDPLLHIGIYGYRRDVLLRLAKLDPTPLERAESLEQLRALEHGISIHVLRLDHMSTGGVDTAEDLAEMKRALREQRLSSDIQHPATTPTDP